jgi:periplasmic protein TonB
VDNKHVFSEGFFTARSGASFILALVAEVLIGLIVAGIIIWHVTHPEPPPPVQKVAVVTIPPNPPPPPPPPPKTPIPKLPTPQPLAEVPAIPSPIPLANAIPPQPPQPPPVPRPQPKVDMAALRATFQSELRQCIQNQAIQHYPREAILASITGTVTVNFDYNNGKITNASVARSSGARSLDRAGMAAVLQAKCPPPPPEFEGRTFNFNIPIQYTLGG